MEPYPKLVGTSLQLLWSENHRITWLYFTNYGFFCIGQQHWLLPSMPISCRVRFVLKCAFCDKKNRVVEVHVVKKKCIFAAKNARWWIERNSVKTTFLAFVNFSIQIYSMKFGWQYFIWQSSDWPICIAHNAQCLKITQNVVFNFSNFGIFHQFLSY